MHPEPVRNRPSSFVLRPTRLGLAFLGLIVVTLVGCVNYALGLGYAVTFLLGGVWVATAAQAYRAGRAVTATLDPPAEAIAGTEAGFVARVTSAGPDGVVVVRARRGRQRAEAVLHVGAGAAASAILPVHAPVRGPLTLTLVQVAALDRLSLWEARRTLPVPEPLIVFPAPEVNAPPPPSRRAPGLGEGTERTRGDEDFSGLRAYVPGDLPQQISWRHAARTGNLLTRETDAPASTVLALDWADTAALGNPEARLARLAAWVNWARQTNTPFRLTLPGVTVPTGSGEAHARLALTALAQHAPQPVPPPRTVEPPAPLPGAPLRFTLLALAFSLAPAALRQPLWITLLAAGVLGYRAARTRRPLPAPPTLLLGLVAGVAAVLLQARFGTLLGRDAGTALLVLLVALKAAETRTRRDARLLALLGLFVTLTHFFFGQGPLAAAHAALSVLLLLAALGGWVAPYEPRPLRPVLRLSAQALPLAALLFVLFPRPDGPLWQLPVQDSRTGLADEISAGDFASLAQSRAVAFRADFTGPLPAPEERYWRGPVYEAYDGLRWTQVRVRGLPPGIESFGPSVTYTLTLEPSGKPWLLALDTPSSLPPGTALTSAFQAVALRPSMTRTRYTLQSRAARLGLSENPARLNFDRQLPDGESPRARALATTWQSLEPRARVAAALRFLRTGGFTYTLSPPTLPERDRVDAFLFGTRRGFCEHYAAAFVFLMRAAGVPARIVGGYLGGEVNPDGGYLIVRQQDAHAWTEVWLPGQGWVRVDPTAVIAPARVNADLPTALSHPSATVAPAPTPLHRAALRLDALQNRWNTWIAGYDGSQQRELLARVGMEQIGGITALVVGAGLLGLALLPLLLGARHPSPADPAARALETLTRRLRLPRAPGETATAYAQRAAVQYPAQAEAIAAALQAYHAARYAPDRNAETLRQLRAAVRRVRRR
ncbi:transglutaminase-like protein [Deinococcus geothermalis DSM 11300]|uniref:Transglutaminase-like protein n=1 Tax=Deinococcus geothermalis (strain DSM 11300 / CIP 105573 / AG-3a) TaxID=319795 RepID=Q1IXE6_DEIGD|nr:transglutaminase-like protein [Deinococcus geothermalis DSM 11300]